MSGMSPYSGFAFSVMTMAIGGTVGDQDFQLARHAVGWEDPVFIAQCCSQSDLCLYLSLVESAGPFLAQPVLDIPLHDTYFVTGHFHLIMGVASIFGIFAATYYWFPKMFGRLMNERLARWHFWFSLVGTYAIFMPMHYLGMAGHPRRYSELTEVGYLHNLLPLQKIHHLRGVHYHRRSVHFLV